MGNHADASKYRTVKSMTVDTETRRLLVQKFRLSKSIQDRLSQVVLAMFEEIDAIADEGWDIVARSLGYASREAAADAGIRLFANWHTGEVTAKEEMPDSDE